MTAPDWDAIARALAARAPGAVAGPGPRAAVALVLREAPLGAIELLFIRRAEHERDPWSGHVGFPGGRAETEDESLEATAVRETREETGIDLRADGERLGALDEVRALARGRPVDLVIAPFVFRLLRFLEGETTHEVVGLHWLPLDTLLETATRSVLEYRHEGTTLELPCLRAGGLVIWGLTYRMFENFRALFRSERRVIQLSPIDHVFTGAGAYPLEFVFAYGKPIDAQRLAESLRATLALFPAVSSRLVRQGEAWALEPTASGCTFETADSAAGFAEAPSRTAFVDPVETLEGEPLARVRLTRTPDGSVLGVSLSHAIVDGFSYFYFLAAWSLVFRGDAVSPPSDERALLAAPAGGPPPAVDAAAVRDGTGLFKDAPRRRLRRGELRWTRRQFRRGELHALHAEAQADYPLRLSHNDVVAAWLWREHVPRWSDASEPLAHLTCPVDVRRVLPGFPGNYFGCAVALANASLPLESLAGTPLPRLARRVRDAVAAVDGPRMSLALTTLDALRRHEGLAAFERLHVVHPRAGLLVTNLSRLPVREIVFDAGPPVGFDVLAPAERCAVVLPAADGLDVRVCEPLPA